MVEHAFVVVGIVCNRRVVLESPEVKRHCKRPENHPRDREISPSFKKKKNFAARSSRLHKAKIACECQCSCQDELRERWHAGIKCAETERKKVVRQEISELHRPKPIVKLDR